MQACSSALRPAAVAAQRWRQPLAARSSSLVAPPRLGSSSGSSEQGVQGMRAGGAQMCAVAVGVVD